MDYLSVKIGFIHPSRPGGEGTGATHTASKIVEILSKNGHNLTVYCVEHPLQDAKSNIDADFKVLQGSIVPHTNVALNRMVRDRVDEFEQYDLVCSYLTPLIPAMSTIGEKTSARTLVTLNAYAGVCPKNDLLYMGSKNCEDNSPSRCLPCIARTSGGGDERGWPYQSASRLGNYGLIKSFDQASQSIDAFHALSTHVKQTYSGFDFPEDRISVVPNPIDESFVVPHESNFLEPYELLYVGSLERHKGVEMLPEMMQRLEESDKEFSLSIVGDGGMRSSLEKSMLDLGLDDLVDFRGHVPYENLPAIYARHDVFVYPGLWQEPFGRIFLEALGAETPVVATNVGAADEILGSAGEVVEPTATAMSDRILSLIHNNELAALSSNARREVERYDVDRIGREFETLYGSLV